MRPALRALGFEFCAGSPYRPAVNPLGYLVTVLVAYLLGSIPTGYLVARARGIDIRAVGSGNIGATNVFRILGKPAGIFVLTADALKGWLSVVVVAGFCADYFGGAGAGSSPAGEWLRIAGGIAAILGHNYTCWLQFKGGKGIATSAGVFLALGPKAFLIALAAWLVVFAVSRFVSLASIAAAVALPLGAWASGSSHAVTGISAAVGALAIYKHKANIQRLRAGTESRVGKKKDETPKA